ncbi:MAG TPA: hypothetical protein VF175_12820, partial [Lacipirellula sp.]
MIAFLVITTIINIALGYALAVYLGGVSATSSTEEPYERPAEAKPAVAAPQSAERVAAAALANAFSAAAASASFAPSPTPEAAAPIAASPSHQEEQEAEPGQNRTSEVEQGLLAGIEEFRNQLAQLKAQNFDEGAPTLAAMGE